MVHAQGDRGSVMFSSVFLNWILITACCSPSLPFVKGLPTHFIAWAITGTHYYGLYKKINKCNIHFDICTIISFSVLSRKILSVSFACSSFIPTKFVLKDTVQEINPLWCHRWYWHWMDGCPTIPHPSQVTVGCHVCSTSNHVHVMAQHIIHLSWKPKLRTSGSCEQRSIHVVIQCIGWMI